LALVVAEPGVTEDGAQLPKEGNSHLHDVGPLRGDDPPHGDERLHQLSVDEGETLETLDQVAEKAVVRSVRPSAGVSHRWAASVPYWDHPPTRASALVHSMLMVDDHLDRVRRPLQLGAQRPEQEHH
jgi:hypothetical protein